MALDIEQGQRRDIDVVSEDRITLALDMANSSESPFEFAPTDFVGNNWFKQGSAFVKLNLTEQDSIVFKSDGLPVLLQKDIVKVSVAFDYDVSNVTGNYPILANVSLTCMEMTNYMLVENIITTRGHIEVDCSLFNFSSNVVNTAISEQGFALGLNFNGVKSNATLKLSNVVIKFHFQNKLEDEILAVSNRLSSSLDFFVEDDEVIIDLLGDGSGGRPSPSGGVDEATVERLITNALKRCTVDVNVQLLTNGYANITATLNRGDV